MRIHTSFIALLGLVALTACGEETRREEAITGPVVEPSAVRFFNFSVGAPTVQFFANDQQVTATNSATCNSAKNPPVTATDTLCLLTGSQSATGVGYGAVAAGGLYSGIDAGQYTFTARQMSSKGPTTTISTVPATIETGKYYSYYQSGFYNSTTKTSDAFIVEDDLPTTIDWSKVLVRFVNTIGNSQPMTLYAEDAETGAETALGGAVAYKTAGPFTALAPTSYKLHARTADGSDKIVRENITFFPGHVYTITARGDMTVTKTTDTNFPFLDSTANQ
jgi:hypothetical protein